MFLKYKSLLPGLDADPGAGPSIAPQRISCMTLFICTISSFNRLAVAGLGYHVFFLGRGEKYTCRKIRRINEISLPYKVINCPVRGLLRNVISMT